MKAIRWRFNFDRNARVVPLSPFVNSISRSSARSRRNDIGARQNVHRQQIYGLDHRVFPVKQNEGSRTILIQRSFSSDTTFANIRSHGEDDTNIHVLDIYIKSLVECLDVSPAASVTLMFRQLRDRSGRVLDLIVPYEEIPAAERRADALSGVSETTEGDGLVLVVHALRSSTTRKLDKICVCSGFVVNASNKESKTAESNVIITCAHTLEEMHRYMQRTNTDECDQSFSFVISSSGKAYLIGEVLSSMPRSDIIALRTVTESPSEPRLRNLSLSPYPVYTGTPILTHLFASPAAPVIQRSKARLAVRVELPSQDNRIEQPIRWLQNKAWRRWGAGIMLGYRSYTGQEIEAGISSVLPHMMTSILPTPGSSGGPIINAQTGSVVGMISGRRMDNRVEGERGWGASAEGIFEMFSLPGFVPSSMKA